jgi:hypothetical protein
MSAKPAAVDENTATGSQSRIEANRTKRT